MHAGGDATLVDPNNIVLLAPDREYRNSHPSLLTSRSTAIGITESGRREILADSHGPGSEGPHPAAEAPPHTVVPRNGGFDLLHRRLVQWVVEHESDLAVEEIALRIVAWVFRAGRRPPRAQRRRATERRHRDLVEAAKAILNLRLRLSVSLLDVAQILSTSPFHLSRVFAAHTGMPLYRYFLRLRLLAVMERVLAGVDITSVAMELGFADHSHLTNQFKREFGVAPSLLRRTPSLAGLRDQLTSLGA